MSLSQTLIKEMMHSFKNTTILFNSKKQKINYPIYVPNKKGKYITLPKNKFNPDLILEDKKNIYCIIKYQEKPLKTIEKNYFLLKTIYSELNPSFKKFYKQQQEKNKKTAKTITNLLLGVYPKFNKFHMSLKQKEKKPKLFYATILCTNKQALKLKKAIKELGIKEKKLKIKKLKKHTTYSLNIAVFYTHFNFQH